MDFQFSVFAGLAIFGGLMTAFHRNIVHSVFGLVGALFGVAGLYWTLGADFLGATQVLLYVGGVTVLLLFAVMLTTRDAARMSPGRFVIAVPVVALLGTGLFRAYDGVRAVLSGSGHVLEEPTPTTDAIGTLLLDRGSYLLPFEVVSVLLLVVLVGAVTLARRGGGSA